MFPTKSFTITSSPRENSRVCTAVRSRFLSPLLFERKSEKALSSSLPSSPPSPTKPSKSDVHSVLRSKDVDVVAWNAFFELYGCVTNDSHGLTTHSRKKVRLSAMVVHNKPHLGILLDTQCTRHTSYNRLKKKSAKKSLCHQSPADE
mmetsp:Transcript_31860/g.74975  ORF Transcript_31860/g.74975 Transcript_31860/m.74975 type:complete len:147 (+) Transcript_31860:2494-2934(+)